MFEETLIESARACRGRLRGMPVPLSIALHALVLGGMVGASLWFVEDAPEPPVPVIFRSLAAPPPPLGVSARSNAVRQQTAKRAPSFSRPVAAPTTASPTTEMEVPAAPETDLEEPGLGAGDPNGVPNSAGDGKSDQIGPERAVEGAIRPGGDVRPPQLLERVEPDYPESERKARKEGIVILEAIITTAGFVDDVRVLKSVDPVLDGSAGRAVARWRYRPATLNGRAVRVYLTVTVRFSLH